MTRITKQGQIANLEASLGVAHASITRERERREAAEKAAESYQKEISGLCEKLERIREVAGADCDALKAEVAGLTYQVAEQRGYIQAMVEAEAIANGDLEQSPPPQPAPRVRRQPPNTQPMFFVDSAVDFSQGVSGRVRQSPKMWWQRGPGR